MNDGSNKKRTAVERVNSRIDNLHEFENHKLRGMKKVIMIICLVIGISSILTGVLGAANYDELFCG